MTSSNIAFTLFTSAEPINKKITMSEDGSLIKESLAHQAYSGGGTTAEVCSVTNVSEFGERLSALNENQCHSYGLPKRSKVGDCIQIVTKKHEQRESQDNQISRSRLNFQYAEGGPGIVMFDYDPPTSGVPLTAEDFIFTLREICPEFQNIELLHRPSASSCVANTNGGLIRGVTGQRVYAIVNDASLIPKLAEFLKARCWLTGYGRYDVSRVGSLLERGPFDFCVYQPERLDFCGKTVLGDGLRQIPLPTLFFPGEHPFLELSTVMLEISDVEKVRIEVAKRNARAIVSEEQNRAKGHYIAEKVQQQVEKEGASADDEYRVEQIRRNILRAVDSKVLHADFEIIMQNGEGVTVAQILDDPDKFHMGQCHDPLEPEYGNSDPRIGLIRIYGSRPHIYSHAHGGQRFRLVRATREIELISGDNPRILEESAELLGLEGGTFAYGDGDKAVLVRAPTASFCVHPYTQETLALKLDELADFYRLDSEGVKRFKDCPIRLAKTLLEAGNYWTAIPPLNAVINHPICRPDGSLVTTEGYDPTTKILLVKTDPDEDWDIEPNPDILVAGRALCQILHPFRLFPFSSSVDLAVFLAALITAVVRSVIKTAPGFLWDANTPGTGKTLLAQCVGALQTGQAPPAVAPPESEEETQKVLLSTLIMGHKVILFDNLDKPLKSSSLCGFLTSDLFSGRILGASKTVCLPNRTLLFFTGNNVQILGDLNRRILRCKIVADVERPDKREFNFCPLEHTKVHRLELIKATLTLIRAAITHNANRPHDVGSYNEWNQLVCSTVCWLAETRSFGQMVSSDDSGWLNIPELADPLKAFDEGFDADPELQNLELLLSELLKVFADKNFSVADIVSASQAYHLSGMRLLHQELALVVNEIASDRNSINTKKLGQYLKRYTGRIVGGLVLINAGKNRSSKCNMFYIESKSESISGVTGNSGVSEAQYEKKVVNIFNISGRDQTPDTTVTPGYA